MQVSTVKPPLTNTSKQQTPPNSGLVLENKQLTFHKTNPLNTGHLPIADDIWETESAWYLEVSLYILFLHVKTYVLLFIVNKNQAFDF